MRGMGLGLAVTALVCSGCTLGDGEGESVEITTTDAAGRTTVVTQEVTQAPEPTDGEVTDAAPTTATLVPTVLDVPGGTRIAFDMPDTWSIVELGTAQRTEPPDPSATLPQQWCLVPADELPAIDGCAGVLLAAGPDWLPGHAGTAYSPRQVEGWHTTPGPLPCPFADDGGIADAATVTSTPDAAAMTEAPTTPDDSEVDLLVTSAEGLPLTTTQSEVNGRTVTYETWRATCSLTEEAAMTPQVWHDLDLGVLVRDYFGSPDTIALVSSLRRG
ncbi:hypothetical protein MWU75_12055 [Ornithinimicrobium sp. F0845]|uniref:hypothetical protein n=1 Tax=Ornithinimicrobium sp. F0845 TaxID=2926412 RepID=UPI001FF340D2|nr:hypothetical protein [Ornithinimicrobium sp. F0845]MCK0112873.1 hypothetical protein [Ornithinimicrobium sp. F0845]